MEYWKELVRDILVYIVSVYGIVTYSRKIGEPTLRGFYCNDDSLRLSYIAHKDWHVSQATLFRVSISVPLVCMVLLEYLRVREACRRNNSGTSWRMVWYRIHITLRNWTNAFNLLLILTETLKYSVGRLRPHFIEVCIPQWDAIECTDINGDQLYISDIPCTTTDLRVLKEARKSFPSGHASVSTFAMVYLVIYLNVRKKFLPKALNLMLKAFCLSFIAYSSVTRVIDHAHHVTDVLAGGFLGALIAGLGTKFASDLLSNKDVVIKDLRKER